MAIFMMEVSRSSRTGSWGPAWTLAHICWSHHQHHHKSFLQHTHFSAPVTLAKTPIFCERAQWCLWGIHTCTPGHKSHRILYQTEPCDDSKAPDQQGSATPTDGCKCSCRSAVSFKGFPRARAVPGWEEDCLFYICSRALSQQVSDTWCKCTGFHFALPRLDAQISLCSQLIEGLSHGKHKVLNGFYR